MPCARLSRCLRSGSPRASESCFRECIGGKTRADRMAGFAVYPELPAAAVPMFRDSDSDRLELGPLRIGRMAAVFPFSAWGTGGSLVTDRRCSARFGGLQHGRARGACCSPQACRKGAPLCIDFGAALRFVACI